MNTGLPRQGDASAPDAEVRAQAVVLRDVVMQGQVALARPRGRDGQQVPVQPSSPGLVSVLSSRNTKPGTPVQGAEAPVQTGSTGSAPDAWADLARVEEEARQRGYEEGFAKGNIEGRARGDEESRQLAAQAAEKASRELEDHAERMTRELKQQAQAGYQARVQVLDGLVAALPPKIEARLAAAEDDMLALCFEVVCRTLGNSAAQPEALRAQLARAMDSLRSRKLVAIHMHPDDLAMLQKGQGLSQALLGGNDVQWVASADVALGGCILQSPEGGLDARFETQLAALRELLLQTRAAARAAEA
ncbi:flagellar assembly protein FliH [Variovorax boronicumulans]|uniref:FliH/SctL family protein n=1 Tax=Variovorax boronicumulans TaxID=436515 RepID=UPI00278B0B7D|nr:FliH/SctL family protein [Variovorax boronicumulans]MDP9992361.1 flagellar assembly protein FliH [Variovorax boronicumulans]MDQ0002467.1 flagellar assembly protein FliH [Variovorax boronicumulans]